MTISEFDIRVAKLRKKLLDELKQDVSPELEELAALEEPDDTPAPEASSGTGIRNVVLQRDATTDTGIRIPGWSAHIPPAVYAAAVGSYGQGNFIDPVMNGLQTTIRSDLLGTRSATVSVRGHEVILDFPNVGDVNRIADSLTSELHPTIVFDTETPDSKEQHSI
jgi:hypothetical protein